MQPTTDNKDEEEILRPSFDYAPNETNIVLYSDTTYVPPVDDEETVLVTISRQRVPFLLSEAMLENYFGISIFSIILGFSFISLNLTFVTNWINGSQLFLEQDAVGYPVLISITIFMAVIQQRMLHKKKYLLFYFIIFPLIFLADIIGNYKTMQRDGFGAPIWCLIFGILYRLIFDLTHRFHMVDIARLQNLVLSYENFIRISIIILSVDFLTMGIYTAKSLLITWFTTLLTIILIVLLTREIMSDEVSLAVAMGISTVGPFAASITGNLVGLDKNMNRKITAIMMFYLLFNVNSIPLISYGLGLSNITEAAWIASAVDSVGGSLASASLGSEVQNCLQCNFVEDSNRVTLINGTFITEEGDEHVVTINVLQGTLISKLLQMLFIGPLYLLIDKFFMRRNTGNRCFGRKEILSLWKLFPKFLFGFLITNLITITLPNEVKMLTIINCYSISQWFLKMGLVMMGFDVNLKIVYLIRTHWRLFLLIFLSKVIDVLVGFSIAYPIYEVWKA